MDFNNDTDVFNQFSKLTKEEFESKLSQTENINSNPLRLIIAPVSYNYSMDILNQLYNIYLKLDQDNKNYSDQKSFEIWGYRVMDMYNIIKAHIETQEAAKKEELLDPMVASVGESVDYLDLCKSGIVMESLNWKISETGMKQKIQDNIEDKFKLNYDDCIRESDCPYYTTEEMEELREEYGFDYYVLGEDESYLNLVRSYQEAFSNDPTEENMIKCLSIGWNPYVSYTNTKFAKQRQMHYYQEHGFRVIDLTKFEDEVVTESTAKMMKEYVDKDMYPVYIVLSFTNTPFGKVIRKVRGSYYTHAGLSLDSDMRNIFTFKYDVDKINKIKHCGFQIEELNYYRQVYKDAEVEILALFVNKATLNIIKSRLNYYVEHQEDSKYNFKNLINILLRRKKDNDPNSLSLICTQFVDTVLKAANIDVTKTPSNLVDPGTFMEISNNPKVYKVYEGRVDKYKESRVENSIKRLFDKEIRSRILYQDSLNLMEEGYYSKILDDMLTPTYAISERVFPLGIRDDGKFNLKIYKSMQDKYQESHDILLTIDQNRERRCYEAKDVESMKYELAKLFYLNSVLTKKIYKIKADDKERKKLVDLRARVLNDFKKYLPKVMEAEKNFNFGKYYSDSEFDRGNLVIDNKLAELIGKKALDRLKKDKDSK